MLKPLSMPDGDVLFTPALFDATESDLFFRELRENIAWEAKQVSLESGSFDLPRLIAWYGDAPYTYSGVTVHPHPWTPTLLRIKQRVEAAAAIRFNSVLLNLYRDQNDSVSWHSDDEPELGENPVIASVSFGATRVFQFKHKTASQQRVSIDLTSGSLVLMRGTTQAFWKHQVPKSKIPCGARINLTFRIIS